MSRQASRFSIKLIAVGAVSAMASLLVQAADLRAVLPTTTLAGQSLTVPEDLGADARLFIIGFSRPSSKHTEAWARKLLDEYGQTSRLAIYQVAVLGDMPHFVRRLVVAGIRRGVPDKMHGRFLVATDKVEHWKRLAGYSEPDSAYIVLVNDRHEMAWRQAGEWSDAGFEKLVNQLQAMDLRP